MRQVAGALAGWLAREWELDLRNEEDADFLASETELLDGVIASSRTDRAGFLEMLRGMYARLGEYRALRGKVRADEVLDSWVDVGWDLARQFVRARLCR